MSVRFGNLLIEEGIKKLLFENNSVILPGLGGFVKEYKPATFDYVQGKISPPSSTISFNDNLIIDDGLLVDYCQKQTGLSLEDTREYIANYVENCKSTLTKKEVFSIPSVGRLLTDFESKRKFVSDSHNFNTDTFGLPEVNYYPVMRNLPKEKSNEEVVIDHIPTASSSSKTSNLVRIGIPVFLAFLVVSSAFFFFNNNENKNLAEQELSGDKLPVNISPKEKSDDSTYDTSDVISTDENNEDEFKDDFENTPEIKEKEIIEEKEVKEDVEKITDESADTNNAGSSNSFSNKKIYVGLFSKQRGVDITTAKIVSLDMVPFTEKTSKGLIKVGVKIPEGIDPNQYLIKVKNKIEKGAYIK